MVPRYLLIANPGTKRCEAYRRAVAEYWAKRGATAELEVVPWATVADADGHLDHLPAFDRPAIVRMESPGKDSLAFRAMLAAGARDDPDEPPQDWKSLELPTGILFRPGLWYRGFRRVLRGLKESFAARPHLRPTACPLAVAAMFDKNGTLATLSDAGIPVPAWSALPASDPIWTSLYRFIRNSGWDRAYVKLNTGSSAVGIVVCEPREGDPRGLSTLVSRGELFCNTRHPRYEPAGNLEPIFQFLRSEGATVQEGLRHAQLDGQNADLRVVCVYGKPAAVIFRLSSQPITNLHLGGRRGDFVRCRAAIPTRCWLDALDACSAAAGCFDSAIAGVDLLFEPGFYRHFVLEVNAFGDFFPGWVSDTGLSLHEIEIAATAASL